MTTASIAYLMSALLIGWRAFSLRVSGAYTCPTCGAKRADSHAPECPWSSRP
jgi:hypothetical protein